MERRLAHQLAEGERYYMLVTGGNGLYRYDINDVVEVQGFHGPTPKVAFVRKGRDVLNVTGEKLHLNHVQSALRTAAERCGLRIWQWRLIPDVEACVYDLLIELREGSIDDAGATDLLTAFDNSLSAENSEYRMKRMSKRLAPPRLHVMQSGWSETICRSDFGAGRRETQYKWSALCDTWDATSRAQVVARFELPPVPAKSTAWP
ncbi:MAG: GH3 auxin-responsive promoter family protein [Actinobacteria bacterium]|nr:GH3 auxin-responsive promoter family protein [Actinomycetota bacterium]